MKVRLRTLEQGPNIIVTFFINGQNSGGLTLRKDEYEPLLLTLVGGAALLKETECDKRVEVEVDDQR